MSNLFVNENQKRFVAELEAIIAKSKRVSTIETVLNMCEKHNVDPEIVAGFLPQTIKDMIESEGREYNLLPKKQRLPL
jgi:transcription elongation factor GreA-like protein